VWAKRSRTTADPIRPAPPVTITFMIGSLR
jgi:hypothetical protein